MIFKVNLLKLQLKNMIMLLLIDINGMNYQICIRNFIFILQSRNPSLYKLPLSRNPSPSRGAAKKTLKKFYPPFQPHLIIFSFVPVLGYYTYQSQKPNSTSCWWVNINLILIHSQHKISCIKYTHNYAHRKPIHRDLPLTRRKCYIYNKCD